MVHVMGAAHKDLPILRLQVAEVVSLAPLEAARVGATVTPIILGEGIGIIRPMEVIGM